MKEQVIEMEVNLGGNEYLAEVTFYHSPAEPQEAFYPGCEEEIEITSCTILLCDGVTAEMNPNKLDMLNDQVLEELK